MEKSALVLGRARATTFSNPTRLGLPRQVDVATRSVATASSGGIASLSLMRQIARRSAVLVPSVGMGVYLSTLDEGKKVAFFVTVLPVRLTRDAITAGSMFFDYSYSLRHLEGDAYEEAKEACHRRGAQRLLRLCFANGGIYIKLGQHIAMLDHLLPEAYVRTMRNHLLDKCPISGWESVQRTIEEDFGVSSWKALFSEFEEMPIASASLAQVHIAKDAKTGERKAVKVQHRFLKETSAVDLAVIHALVGFVKYLAPNADFMWLVNEANENLVRFDHAVCYMLPAAAKVTTVPDCP